MAKQDDGLFLLEVLIDKIIYSKTPCFGEKNFRTCVHIHCPTCDKLEICDDDPDGIRSTTNVSSFVKSLNSGKSCLFSMKQADIANAMSKFPIKVSVYKELPCGCLPAKINLGEATIDMTKEFVQARTNFLEDPNNVSYEALKDSFRLTAPDGTETGEILMFLRISCFGKLIITKFQGGGAPALRGAGSDSVNIDRSCNPPRGFQTRDDPCACGASRGAASGAGAGGYSGGADDAGGACHRYPDPYNSMPCEEFEDPCCCTGPKPPHKQPMACRNTDQYCLHVPKGGPLSTPRHRSLPKEQEKILAEKSLEELLDCLKCQNSEMYVLKNILKHNLFSYQSGPKVNLSTMYLSTCNPKTKRRSVYFSKSDYIWTKPSKAEYRSMMAPSVTNRSFFPNKETAIYMTLFDQFCRHRTSGTQATATISKSLQVSDRDPPSVHFIDSEYCSTCSTATTSYNMGDDIRRRQYSELYFFSKKRNHHHKKTEDSDGPSKSVQAQSMKGTSSVQTLPMRSVEMASTTSKNVSIREPIKANPDAPDNNHGSSIIATVSHIKIGPTCLVHGPGSCHGPNCIAMGLGPSSDAASKNAVPHSDSEATKVPVKVTTVTNPRRGVFELVIRRLNGAPLAKNELMLEWSPPQVPSPCERPCPSICSYPLPLCRPVKCKTPICRPFKCRSKKSSRCKFPCGPKSAPCAPCSICGKVSCQACPAQPCIACKPKCSTRRGKFCKPCKPCRPCRPCRPCYPPFPFKPSVCNVSCNAPGPCPKPCKSIRRCKYPRPCRPSPCRPCGPCAVYRACVPDLTCPASKTSIVFKSCPPKPKSCYPCRSTCSSYASCFSCYPCIPIIRGNHLLPYSFSHCTPLNTCDGNLSIRLDQCISSDPCIPANNPYRSCEIIQPTDKFAS